MASKILAREYQAKNYKLAEPPYALAYALAEKHYGEKSEQTAELAFDIGTMYMSAGESRKAIEYLSKTRSYYERIDKNHHKHMMSIMRLAHAQRDLEHFSKAAQLYKLADAIARRRNDPAEKKARANLYHGWGWSLANLGQFDEAEEMIRKSTRYNSKMSIPNSRLLDAIASLKKSAQ